MLLVKATGNTVEQYPYSVGLLRKDNPRTSFPKQPSASDMAAFNVYPVTEANPTVGDGQKLVKTWTPTLVSGDWVLAHQAVDLTAEEIDAIAAVVAANARQAMLSAIQSMLDDSSKSRGYDSIISECSYATSTGTFGAEAQITVDWRDAVWTYVYSVQDAIIAESREAPTIGEMLAELPTR